MEVGKLAEDHHQEPDKDESDVEQDRDCELGPYEVVDIRMQIPLDSVDEGWKHGADIKAECADRVEQEQEEVLAVPEPHTVIDPGTVMIHVEYTTIAGRAVVTAIGLEHVAHQTVAFALYIRIAHVEALFALSSPLPSILGLVLGP